MPQVLIPVDFPDDQFKYFLMAGTPIQITIMPSGLYLTALLNELYAEDGEPLHIVETGCLRDTDPVALFTDGWSTFYLARWVAQHEDSKLTTVDIDSNNITKCMEFLHQFDLELDDWIVDDSLHAIGYGVVGGESGEVDVFVLDACDGLEHGLEEFKAALTYKPRLIIMDDYDKKVKLAAEYADTKGITYRRLDRYTVFKPTYEKETKT